MPIRFSLAVAGALSTVYAVRSSEGPFGAIGAALRLAFEQKWRVFWPSYLLAILGALLYWVAMLLQSALFGVGLLIALAMAFVTTALGIMMTFVIERAYAPQLTLPDGERQAPSCRHGRHRGQCRRRAFGHRRPLSSRYRRRRARSRRGSPRTSSRIVCSALQRRSKPGLAADARFFVTHPDQTLVVGKRLAAAQRSDLALRLAQPYLKEHRGHSQHLTVALFVANLLRDLQRSPDAARFLVQVKALYPNEPMVDQLIKITNKALAAEGAPAA